MDFQVWPENGLKNYIFWSEIGSGFEEPGSTPPLRIPRSTPRGYKPNPTQPEDPSFHLLDFGILEKDTPGIAQDLCGACTACWQETILNPGLIVVPFVHQGYRDANLWRSKI